MSAAELRATVPGQVTVIRGGPGGGSGEIGVDWTGVPGATGYRIERADTSNGPFSIAADLNLVSGAVTMVGPGVGNITGDQQNFYPPSAATHAGAAPSRYFRYVEFPVVGYTFSRHYFRVTAYNSNGDGARSVVVCGTPPWRTVVLRRPEVCPDDTSGVTRRDDGE